jgi:hypothetical protein
MYVRGCREREREYLKGVVQIGGKTLLVHVATLLGSEMSPREHKTCLQQLMINICPGSIRARCFPFAEGAAHCESVQFDNNCVLWDLTQLRGSPRRLTGPGWN